MTKAKSSPRTTQSIVADGDLRGGSTERLLGLPIGDALAEDAKQTDVGAPFVLADDSGQQWEVVASFKLVPVTKAAIADAGYETLADDLNV
jgi:hypothetical protein